MSINRALRCFDHNIDNLSCSMGIPTAQMYLIGKDWSTSAFLDGTDVGDGKCEPICCWIYFAGVYALWQRWWDLSGTWATAQ